MLDWTPFWTDETAIEKGGRYPLLFNRFHDHLEEYLIKSIVTVTDRLRYISYCCWIIGDIENTIKCKKYIEFEEAFRRRESALAIGTILLNPETDMGNYTTYGRNTMRGTVEDLNKLYKTSVPTLPSNPLGAFGQYYKGTLQNWGLTYVSEDGLIYLTESGAELYKIMDNHYQNSHYYIKYKGHNEVPGQVLHDWADVNHYDNITDDNHQDERNFYKQILFYLNTDEVSDRTRRRDTFVIYMEVMDELSKKGFQLDTQIFQDYLRNILYDQSYFNDEGIKHTFKVSHFLQEARFVWMIYEIHVYYRWWIEEFFKAFLNLLRGSENGLSLEEVINNIEPDIFNEKIYSYLNDAGDYLNMTFHEFEKVFSNYQNLNNDLLLEDIVSYDSFIGFSEISAGLIMIIVLLNNKTNLIKNDRRYIGIRTSYVADFWFKDIGDNIVIWRDKSVVDFLKIILKKIVIYQHDKAMYEKMDLRRCWFTSSADKYQWRSDSTSIWRPAKHNIICNFLYDMGVINVIEGVVTLSQEGKDLYLKLKDDYYEK